MAAPLNAKYTIELCKEGGLGAGIDGPPLDAHDDLTVARMLYRMHARERRERVVLLCDRARVLARSDRPETMPR